jgi:endonuclease III
VSLLSPEVIATGASQRLHDVYGSPRHGNHDDPVDELVFIVLSQMTTRPSYERVFERLCAVPGGWEGVAALGVEGVRALIGDGGLAGQKAPRLLAALEQIRADFGRVCLDQLRTWSDAEAESYLTALPGVGIKTARCVLMYSFGRQVLPADTHVTRLARALGLVPGGASPVAVHATLEEVVPPAERYSFHVNGLAHGRAVCRARRPRCWSCVLADICPSGELASQASASSSPSGSVLALAGLPASAARAVSADAHRPPSGRPQQTTSSAGPRRPAPCHQAT